MCGIAGFCLNPKDHTVPEAAVIAAALMLAIEERGTDATGMAWAEQDWRKARLHKAPVKASQYVPQHAERMSPDATLAVLHTRMATQGSPQVNGNNHPIVSGSVIGVHNGHIGNDDTLFKNLGCERKAEVDSEAAFANLAYGTGPITERLRELQGRVALAWMDRRDMDAGDTNTLHMARVNGSPLAVGQTKKGSLIFASTMALLHIACDMAEVDLGWDLDVPEGVYMRVRNGRIVSYETFEKPTYTPWWESKAMLARLEGKSRGKNRKAGSRSFSSGKRSGETTPYPSSMYALGRDGEWKGLPGGEDYDEWRWEDDEFIRSLELSAQDMEV